MPACGMTLLPELWTEDGSVPWSHRFTGTQQLDGRLVAQLDFLAKFRQSSGHKMGVAAVSDWEPGANPVRGNRDRSPNQCIGKTGVLFCAASAPSISRKNCCEEGRRIEEAEPHKRDVAVSSADVACVEIEGESSPPSF